MKHLVVLGAGTGGMIVANRASRELGDDWTVTVVDPATAHLYQPGLVFLPFGAPDGGRDLRPRAATLARGVRWVEQAVAAVEPDAKRVVVEDGTAIPYDQLVIASGSFIRPEETDGLLGAEWGRSIHDFYTLEGARALRAALERFEGGRLVVDVVEMPIKCPVAPLEFAFLADAYFERRGIRDRVELVLVTPLDAAFTKPVASRLLGSLLERKGIEVVTDFSAGEVDADAHVLRSYDEREVTYDMLVSVPTHSGAEFVERSGLGDELAFVPTDPATLAARDLADVFVLGDATNLPTSKAGSVAHFQSEVVAENLRRASRGMSPCDGFDGHANCFVETGFGKALLIDFNYDVEPLPGRYPLPWLGPMSLLRETRLNHLGKLGFRWLYWNALLPARPLPVPNRMSMWGKRPPPGWSRDALKGASHAA